MSLILAVDFQAQKPTVYQFEPTDNPYPDPEKITLNAQAFETAFELKKHIESLNSQTNNLVIGYRLPCSLYSPMTPEFITNPMDRETLEARVAHGQILGGRETLVHIQDIIQISNTIEHIAIYDPVHLGWNHEFKEVPYDCFYGLSIRGAIYSAVTIQKNKMLDALDNVTLTVNFGKEVTITASRGIKVIEEYFDCVSGYNLKKRPEDIAYHMMGLTTRFGQPNHIVFTGGSGNTVSTRSAVLDNLPLLDFTIDEQLLYKRTNGVISQIGSKVRIYTLEDQSALDMLRRIKHALEYRNYTIA